MSPGGLSLPSSLRSVPGLSLWLMTGVLTPLLVSQWLEIQHSSPSPHLLPLLVLPLLSYLLAPLTLASPASLLAGSASLLVLLASSLANSDPRSVVVSFLLVVARLSRSFWSVGLSYGLMCGANFIMISGEE